MNQGIKFGPIAVFGPSKEDGSDRDNGVYISPEWQILGLDDFTDISKSMMNELLKFDSLSIFGLLKAIQWFES